METTLPKEDELKIRAERAVDRIPEKTPLEIGAFYLKMALYLKKWPELEEGLKMAEPMLRILYSDPGDILADVQKLRAYFRQEDGRTKPLWRSADRTLEIYQENLEKGFNRFVDYEAIRTMRRQIKGVKQQTGLA